MCFEAYISWLTLNSFGSKLEGRLVRHGGGGSASGNKDHCVGHCCRVHRRLVSPQLVGPDGMCRASALSSETRSMNCLLASPSSRDSAHRSFLRGWERFAARATARGWARFMTASRGGSASWPSSRRRRAARPCRLRLHIRTTSRRKVAMSAELLFAIRSSASFCSPVLLQRLFLYHSIESAQLCSHLCDSASGCSPVLERLFLYHSIELRRICSVALKCQAAPACRILQTWRQDFPMRAKLRCALCQTKHSACSLLPSCRSKKGRGGLQSSGYLCNEEASGRGKPPRER